MELADVTDSKSVGSDTVSVRVRPPAPLSVSTNYVSDGRVIDTSNGVMHDKVMTKPGASPRKRGQPFLRVKHGSAVVPIYKGRTRKWDYFTVAFHMNGKRVRRKIMASLKSQSRGADRCKANPGRSLSDQRSHASATRVLSGVRENVRAIQHASSLGSG